MRYYNSSRFLSDLPAPIYAVIMSVGCLIVMAITIKSCMKMKRGEQPIKGWIFIIPAVIVMCILSVTMRLYEFFYSKASIPQVLHILSFLSLVAILVSIIFATVFDIKKGNITKDKRKSAIVSICFVVVMIVLILLLLLRLN